MLTEDVVDDAFSDMLLHIMLLVALHDGTALLLTVAFRRPTRSKLADIMVACVFLLCNKGRVIEIGISKYPLSNFAEYRLLSRGIDHYCSASSCGGYVRAG